MSDETVGGAGERNSYAVLPVERLLANKISAKIIGLIFINGENVIVGQGIGIIQAIAINLEFGAIIAVEAVVSANPHKPFMILENAANGIIAKPLLKPEEVWRELGVIDQARASFRPQTRR